MRGCREIIEIPEVPDSPGVGVALPPAEVGRKFAYQSGRDGMEITDHEEEGRA
jgi:hypothetical protein